MPLHHDIPVLCTCMCVLDWTNCFVFTFLPHIQRELFKATLWWILSLICSSAGRRHASQCHRKQSFLNTTWHNARPTLWSQKTVESLCLISHFLLDSSQRLRKVRLRRVLLLSIPMGKLYRIKEGCCVCTQRLSYSDVTPPIYTLAHTSV